MKLHSELIIKKYSNGMSLRQIANSTCLSHERIRQILRYTITEEQYLELKKENKKNRKLEQTSNKIFGLIEGIATLISKDFNEIHSDFIENGCVNAKTILDYAYNNYAELCGNQSLIEVYSKWKKSKFKTEE